MSRCRLKHNRMRRQSGFTLLSVLVSMVVLMVGLLSMMRAIAHVTNSVTHNQNVSFVATVGNSFWGVVQSNPALVTAGGFNGGAYTSANIGSAPAALQGWLTQTMSRLPSGKAVIATGPDAGGNGACDPSTGCTVRLTLQWSQVGSPGTTASEVKRTQVFDFQFGGL